MSSNFYVSDQYRHLLHHQQQPQPTQVRHNNPIIYHPNYQQQPHVYQPPNVYVANNNNRLPQQQYYQQQQYQHYQYQQPQQQHYQQPQQYQPQYRYGHDSYAAQQPNPRFSPQNNNLYPTLQPAKQANQYQPITPIDQTKQIIHKVQYGDTLEGLSLIYDVPISKIKQRNSIEGDSIYYLKQVIIPNPKAEPLQLAKTQQFYIEEMMTYMPASEKSQKTARYYLQESDWNVDNAVKAFKQDLQWQKKNKVEYKSIPINNENRQNLLNYSQYELLQKKRQ